MTAPWLDDYLRRTVNLTGCTDGTQLGFDANDDRRPATVELRADGTWTCWACGAPARELPDMTPAIEAGNPHAHVLAVIDHDAECPHHVDADLLVPEISPIKHAIYLPISNDLLMDTGAIPDTRVHKPIPRRLRFRWWRRSLRDRIAAWAYERISGQAFPDREDY